jgi:hypothetical protein
VPKGSINLNVPRAAEFSFGNNELLPDTGSLATTPAAKMVTAGSRGRAGRYALTRRGGVGGIGDRASSYPLVVRGQRKVQSRQQKIGDSLILV